MKTRCEECAYFDENEEVCNMYFEEDEMARFLSASDYSCPYFKFYDEYKMVERQN